MQQDVIPSFAGVRAASRAFLTAALTLVAMPLLAAEVTIQPDEDESKDSFAYSFLSNWAFDTDSFGLGSAYGDLLTAGATSSGVHDTVSYLEFDLTDLELLALTSSDVIEARLYVYVGSSSSSGFGANPSTSYSVDVTLYEVEEDWAESSLTWSNRPSYSNAVDSVTIDTTGYWISFDVTSSVGAWLDGVIDNYGIALEQDSPVSNGTNQVVAVFDSSAGSNKPYLKVTY